MGMQTYSLKKSMKKIIDFLKKQKIFIFLTLAVLVLFILKIYFQKKKPLVKYEKKPPSLEKEIDTTGEAEPFVSEKKKEEKKQKEELKHISSPFPAKRPTETEGTEEDTRQTLKLYPLIEYLPINNERYYLTYTKPFELTVTIKQGNEREIKKEIIDWIVSKNIDPKNHKIIFE